MRTRKIGGTDLGACISFYRPELADFSPYQTASDLWMRLVHNVERSKTAAMQRGIDAEPKLRRAYLDAYGGLMADKPTPWILQHPTHPFVTVSPDDVWVGTPNVYVEFKSSSLFSLFPRDGSPSKWGEPEGDAIPPGYNLQVQLNLEILDLETGHLFVGFGKDAKDEDGTQRFFYSETRRYIIQRDRELMGMALEYAERFHDEFISTGTPPGVAPKSNLREWSRLMKEKPWTAATEA